MKTIICIKDREPEEYEDLDNATERVDALHLTGYFLTDFNIEWENAVSTLYFNKIKENENDSVIYRNDPRMDL